MMTPISTIRELVSVTNTLDNKYFTVQEMWDMAEIAEELTKVVKRHDVTQKKLIEDLGGYTIGNGQYGWEPGNIEQQKNITKALFDSSELEFDIIHKTNVLTKASIEKFIVGVSTTPRQLFLIKEYFIVKE